MEPLAQFVLRCGQCNKPFDKQSTLKRHGYYCRSRRAGAKTARSRSCISCVRGKTRCDNRQPKCSRCITKAIDCRYPANVSEATESRTQGADNSPQAVGQELTITPLLVAGYSSRTENHGEVCNGGEALPDGTLAGLSSEHTAIGEELTTNFVEEHLDWRGSDVDLASFLNLQTVIEPLTESTSLGSATLSFNNQSAQVEQARPHQTMSIPAQPSVAVRSLEQRPKLKNGPQRTANLMLHTLKSYPLMIMRCNILPPFIHPNLASSGVEDSQVEPLNNCISLLHMISSGVSGSRKLFWRNVRLECERLHEEHTKLNKWGLFAALQAVTIYFLIRLGDGETEHNNHDALLIITVTMLCKRLTYERESWPAKCGFESTWKEWIFEESRRRLLVVYRILDMLVYFEPMALCSLQADLVLAPLPAKKQQWEADNEAVWRTLAGNEPSMTQTSFGLAATGDLVELIEDNNNHQLYQCDAMMLYKSSSSSLDTTNPSNGDGSSGADAGNWEEWCSGMDSFGGLIMLAASLIQ